VTVDAQGNVYAVDNGNARVQELSPAGRALQQFPSASSRDPAAQLNDPTNVTIGPDGKVFVTDHGNQRIAIFKLDATFVGSIFKYKKHGGTLRKFNSLAIDKVGNMYATDLDNDQVLKLSPSGAWLAQWGSPGNGQRQFSEPEGVATGPEGNVYVVDHDNSRVLEFSLAGARAKYVRTIGQGYLDHPEGVAVDHSGNVYVADTNNDRIDIFSARGHFIRAFGVHGAGRGQMLSPASVAVDGQDNIYVADWGNDRIEKFSPRGHLLWETPVRSLA
jgi:DNA-binding beta-propeller fold protein YncE